MENVIQFDPVALQFYKKLKRAAYKHLALDFVETNLNGEDVSEFDGKGIKQPYANLNKLVNVVEIDFGRDVHGKIRFVLGLMVTVYFKFNGLGRTTCDDLDYVGNCLSNKYLNYTIDDEIKSLNSIQRNKIVSEFEKMIDEVG